MSDTEYKLSDEQMHAAFSTIAEEAAQVTFEEFMEDEAAEYLRRFGRAIEAATAAKYAERIADLQAKLDAAAVNTDRLDSLIFHSATVCHSNDAEWCYVRWSDEDGDHFTQMFSDARAAIDAMKEAPKT